jgi:probable HAF family extracellular repeat protein
MRISLYAGLALALAAGHAAAGSFTDVGVVGGQLTSLSHNGRIAGGIVGDSAWRWNKDSGAVVMTGFVSSNGMNSWGQPMVGAYTPDANIADAVAAVWYTNSDLLGGPDVIGGYPGTGGGTGQGISEAYGVSDNGIAVGLAYDETNNPIAFRWTAVEGMTRLTVNRPDTFSRANGISHDGSTVYGWNDQEDGVRSGVIWQNGVPLDLVDVNHNPVGEALASSGDGSVVVGGNLFGDTGADEAWRWTAATGVQSLGFITGAPAKPGKRHAYPMSAAHSEKGDAKLGTAPEGFFPPQAYAFAVSDDGKVVVGGSGIFPVRHAFVWTQATGMVLLSDYAAAHGVTIPTGWDLSSANAVSADGQVIAGWGFNGTNVASFVIDLHNARTFNGAFEAHGTVGYNDLPSGPFAGVPVGTPVTMTFQASPNGFEISPGQYTAYPILLPSFKLRAGNATETLVSTTDGPSVGITNDYPKSDGIHLFSTPTASGQAFEFELFNPGGDMYDSDDLNRINRTFGPEFFEKISWIVSQGDQMMWIDLQSVRISDARPRLSAH